MTRVASRPYTSLHISKFGIVYVGLLIATRVLDLEVQEEDRREAFGKVA